MLPLPAGREASAGVTASLYARHRLERALLYQLVEDYYPGLKAQLAAPGSALPGSVEREFDEYLKCGRLEHGFLRVRCETCHAEHLLAFSCKRRGCCPRCGAGRMAESAALLVDEVFPKQPVRQWVLSFPYPLRFLFASRAAIMGRVLGIVYRCITTHLIKKAGFSCTSARTGAVTLIQRFGRALNLNIHCPMLFLDDVYIDCENESNTRFRWVKAPTSAELTQLTHTIAHRVGRFLERHGLLEGDAENSYLSEDAVEGGLLEQLVGHSVTYRIAVGPHAGRKVFTLQTLPDCKEPSDDCVGKVAGFSLHGGRSQGTRAQEAGTLLPLYRQAGGVGKAAVAMAQWPGALRTQDAVSRGHHARHFRADGLHRPPWCPSLGST